MISRVSVKFDRSKRDERDWSERDRHDIGEGNNVNGDGNDDIVEVDEGEW